MSTTSAPPNLPPVPNPSDLQSVNNGRSWYLLSPGPYGSFELIGPGEVGQGLSCEDGPVDQKNFQWWMNNAGQVYLRTLNDAKNQVTNKLLVFDFKTGLWFGGAQQVQIGPMGPQGIQGIQGIQGPIGPIGPASPAGAGVPVVLIGTPTTRVHRLTRATLQPDGVTILFGESAFSIDRVVVNGLEIDFGYDYDVVNDPNAHGNAIGIKQLPAIPPLTTQSWTGARITVVYAVAPELKYSI